MQAILQVGLAVVALSASGCASDGHRAETPIGAPRLIELAVAERDRIRIRIPAGDVEIVGTDGDRLRGALVIKCPDTDGPCARRLGDVAFVGEVTDGEVDLRLNHNRSYRYRGGDVQVSIEVPKSREVEVRMTAGDLVVRRVPACLAVDMGAGDVEILAAAATVRRVMLDAGVGDAGLAVDGRYLEAPRSWLIGAELAWEQGAGVCDLVVDLQAGDIQVSLEE